VVLEIHMEMNQLLVRVDREIQVILVIAGKQLLSRSIHSMPYSIYSIIMQIITIKRK